MFRLALLLALVSMTAGLDSRTIMEYLEASPQFSTLLGILKESHFDIVLQAPGAIYTLFAPTNYAFMRMEPGLLDYIKSEPKLLQSVIMGHVLDSAFISLDIYNERLETTLDGHKIRFNVYNNGHTYTVGGATILTGDAVLKNGVVHALGDVILPAEGDILRQILVDDAEFEDLAAAMALTNILEELQYDHLTLFAPTNGAFRRYFPTSQSLSPNINEWRDLLQNHVVNGTYYIAGLLDGVTLTTLAGHQLHITINGTSEVLVNGYPIDGEIFSTNGIVHVMNNVLAPPS